MIKGIVNCEKVEDADAVIVGAPYEKTASSHKGTVFGPRTTVTSLDTQIEFFDRNFKLNVNDYVSTYHTELTDLPDLTPEENLTRIHQVCDDLVQKGKFIFLLGGEHAVSLGHFKALAKKHDPKDVTILQIDAHCDLRNDDSDYSENPSNLAHSTIMRRASELGYPIVQVGIRTYSEDEYKYFSNKKNNITVFEWDLPAQTGNGHSIEEIISSIKTKYIYISIDVDGFDPSVMPGTGTPVPGGLTWEFGKELLTRAIDTHELIGADIVEISPVEHSTITEYSSAQLLYTMLAHKFKARFQ